MFNGSMPHSQARHLCPRERRPLPSHLGAAQDLPGRDEGGFSPARTAEVSWQSVFYRKELLDVNRA